MKANLSIRCWAALDLHALNCVLGWMNTDGELVKAVRFATTEEELIKAVRALGKTGVVITLEAGPMTRWAVRILRPLVEKVIVCDPRKNKLVSQDARKNDFGDVERLCELLRLNGLKEVWMGQDESRDLFREAVGEWLGWRDQQRHLKTLIKGKYRQWGITQMGKKDVFNADGRNDYLHLVKDPEQRSFIDRLYRQFDQAWAMWLETGRQVRRMSKKYPEVAVFQEIPGIADVGSNVFSAMVEDPHRFPEVSKVWRFCKLGIVDKTSDGKPLGYQRLDRAGHGELKNVAYTAWRTACKSTTGDNEVKRYYLKSLERTHSVRHARLNTQRKILEVMWTIWRKGVPYDPKKFFPQATPPNKPTGVAG